ncbi:MAG: carboxylating nicotinate-nucleotide diphosphorylase [Planctomycetes bacterium]|nr:carboxylating nicotinate-nucleotide diphosphorylase [Planctomycetota bacterium]
MYERLESTGFIRRLLELARDEDLGVAPAAPAKGQAPSGPVGDITSNCCIPPDRCAVAHLVARCGGVICGLASLPLLLELFAPTCRQSLQAHDGDRVEANRAVATIHGPLDEILGLERTMLNLVGRLSGIATRTALFASRIPAASRAHLYDTRKTTPGLRVLEKYAVRCGGGRCHRMGLFDAVLIKDNHLAGISIAELPEYIASAAAAARSSASPSFIEVEVDTLAQFDALLSLPPGTIDIVLLDNMSPAQLSHAATARDTLRSALELEASGGITLETITQFAQTGVDRISVGGLTHSAVSLDVALDVEG